MKLFVGLLYWRIRIFVDQIIPVTGVSCHFQISSVQDSGLASGSNVAMKVN